MAFERNFKGGKVVRGVKVKVRGVTGHMVRGGQGQGVMVRGFKIMLELSFKKVI